MIKAPTSRGGSAMLLLFLLVFVRRIATARAWEAVAEFIAKCGDSLREIEESAYWLELLVESGVVSVEKLASLRQECES
jgi:four helix bundle protein